MRLALPFLFFLLLLALPAPAKDYTCLSAASGVLFGLEDATSRQPLAGIKAGYWLIGETARQSLGIEAVFLYGDSQAYLLRADALYPVFSRPSWTSYLSLGFGALHNNAVAAYGLALAYQPNIPLFLRLDGRQLQKFAAEHDSGWELGLQLGYTFGYARKPPPKPRPDADADGIPDTIDRCPDTPKELTVDPRGCPRNPPDSDGDRIPDYLDKCPDTAASWEVAADGCPPDSDGDGIPDVQDRCPHNPPGMTVDIDGCVKISHD